MRAAVVAALLCLARADAHAVPLDLREPPFGEFDFSWLQATNRQPPSLLGVGPVTLSLYVDAYYQWQFWQPADHTVFPSTTAPRHNELSVNLAAFGLELTGLDGPIGRLTVQWGSNLETDAGQDTTSLRGFYLNNRAFNYIQQAAAGWHFHWLHGFNAEIGIFNSYFSVESYLPQENWNYTHSFLADSTPYYLSGIRAQLYPTRRLKVELWLMNGWQTFGKWHEAEAGGYFVNWRPREWAALATAGYVGQDVQSDAHAVRFYSDHSAQLRVHRGRRVRSVSLLGVADFGYELREKSPSGFTAGAILANRIEWTSRWATALRIDVFYDQRQALIPQLPVGSRYVLPNSSAAFLGAGVTLTQDFLPSPWMLVRLEFVHRQATIPYFSGPNGITGPGGIPAVDPTLFAPDLRTYDDRVLANVTLRL